MNALATPSDDRAGVPPEDRARADFYALISRLLYAGPDAALLAAIAGAGEIAAEGTGDSLARSWNSLVSTAAATDAGAAQAEYDSVFVGTGKAEVTPYASGYINESTKESVLVQLRAELDAMGLGRQPGVAEYEDHFAGLFEVMRHLILSSDSGDVAVQTQKKFFFAYLDASYQKLCDSVITSGNTNFYKHVARFTRAFLDLEKESFDVAQ